MNDLRVERTFAAPAAQVWRALTDAAALAAWFWPPQLDPTVEIDARPGAAFRIAGTGMAVAGTYSAVEPPHRLAFTWRWDGDDEQTTVTMDLADRGDHAALTVTHKGFSTASARDDHIVGWSDCLDRLPAWLSANAQAPASDLQYGTEPPRHPMVDRPAPG